MKTLSVIALCLLLSACGGGEDEATATSYVATLNAACAQSGGTVASDGKQNCDYTASISYAVGANVDSADTTTLANELAVFGECGFRVEPLLVLGERCLLAATPLT